MGLAASRQLIDRYAAVFLPDASGRDRRFAGRTIFRRAPSRARTRCQRVPKLTPAADQAIEVGQVSLNLRSQAFIHGLRLPLLAGVTAKLASLQLQTGDLIDVFV